MARYDFDYGQPARLQRGKRFLISAGIAAGAYTASGMVIMLVLIFSDLGDDVFGTVIMAYGAGFWPVVLIAGTVSMLVHTVRVYNKNRELGVETEKPKVSALLWMLANGGLALATWFSVGVFFMLLILAAEWMGFYEQSGLSIFEDGGYAAIAMYAGFLAVGLVPAIVGLVRLIKRKFKAGITYNPFKCWCWAFWSFGLVLVFPIIIGFKYFTEKTENCSTRAEARQAAWDMFFIGWLGLYCVLAAVAGIGVILGIIIGVALIMPAANYIVVVVDKNK